MSELIDFKLRAKKVTLFFIGLYLGYFILSYLFNITMAKINYFVYPAFVLFWLSILLDSGKFYYQNLVNKRISHKNEKLASRLNSKLQYVSVFFRLVIFFCGLIVTIVLVPAIFLNATVSNDNLSQVIRVYCTHSWWMIPWPAILTYFGLYNIWLHVYNLNDFTLLINKLWPRKIKNDTENNILSIIYSTPYITIICLFLAVGIYSSYLFLASIFSIPMVKGTSVINLTICALSILIVVQKPIHKKTKTILRQVNYHNWSIGKFFLIISGGLLLWLIVCSLILWVLTPVLTIGKYNFYQYNLSAIYINLVTAMWWYLVPSIALFAHRQTTKHSMINISYQAKPIIITLAIICSLWLAYVNHLFILEVYNYIKDNVSQNYKLAIIAIIIFGLIYKLFAKKHDKNTLIVGFINGSVDSVGNKTSPASKTYYGLFIITAIFLIMLSLENIFLLQKLMAYMSILGTILLIILLYGHHNHIKHIKHIK
ncbi:MAG: hypothetical protein KBD64_00125 [Gammaproteobacteria bacterium]|nr:hypothetical protein [Gammaproteobacteria bacterium]